MRVLDGLSREDGDFVAVDLDGPLRRRWPFARLKPSLDVGRTPDDLHLVLLQRQVVADVEIRAANLVEGLVWKKRKSSQ